MTLFDTVMSASGIITPIAAIAVWFMVHRTIFSLPDIEADRRLKRSLSVLFFIVGWLAVSNILGMMGIFTRYSQLVLVFAFGIPFLGMKLISKSKVLTGVMLNLPLHLVIGIQFYRILGIIFLALYSMNLMPAEFAIPAGVGDIIVGISAPIVAYMIFKRKEIAKRLAIIWNYVGIADLVIAVMMGSFTASTMLQFLSLNAPNDLIITYPLVTVPTFAVPFAFLLHLIALEILKKR